MRIAERAVAILLSEDGRGVLEASAIHLESAGALLAYVQDTDDIGLWIRLAREDGEHLLLVRWEYVLSLDFPAGETKTVGLRV